MTKCSRQGNCPKKKKVLLPECQVCVPRLTVVDVVICEISVTYSGHASVLLGCLAQLRCLSHFHLHSSHFLFVQSSSEARISNPIISFGPLASPRDFHVSVREGKE